MTTTPTCPSCGQELDLHSGGEARHMACPGCNVMLVVSADSASVTLSDAPDSPRFEAGATSTDQTDDASFVEAVAQALQVQDTRKNTFLAKFLYLLVSVVLFAGFAAIGRSPEYVILIIMVLLLHELGHVAAMKIFGFKDVQMLFIPAFGAMVHGHPSEPSGFKSAAVALMGPAPGIVLGIIAYILSLGGGHPWIDAYAKTSLFINTFNLLPFLPLDGGRIVQATLLAAFPRASWILVLLGGLLLAGLAWLTKSILVAFLALLMLLSIPRAFKEGRIISFIRGKLSGDPPASESPSMPVDYLRCIIADLRGLTGSGVTEEAGRAAKVARAIWDAAREQMPSRQETQSIVAIYLLMVVVGVGLSASLVRPKDDQQLTSAFHSLQTGEYEKAIAAADTVLVNNPQNADALIIRASGLFHLKDFQDAESTIDDLLAMDSTQPAGLLMKALILREMDDVETAEYYFTRAIALKPDWPAPYFGLADLCLIQGRRDEACKHAMEGHRRDPQNPERTAALASYYVLCGRKAESDSLLRLAKRQGYPGKVPIDSIEADRADTAVNK